MQKIKKHIFIVLIILLMSLVVISLNMFFSPQNEYVRCLDLDNQYIEQILKAYRMQLSDGEYLESVLKKTYKNHVEEYTLQIHIDRDSDQFLNDHLFIKNNFIDMTNMKNKTLIGSALAGYYHENSTMYLMILGSDYSEKEKTEINLYLMDVINTLDNILRIMSI